MAFQRRATRGALRHQPAGAQLHRKQHFAYRVLKRAPDRLEVWAEPQTPAAWHVVRSGPEPRLSTLCRPGGVKACIAQCERLARSAEEGGHV